MYHIKDDQRSIRSAELLHEGLVKLMQEKPFHSIKVKDLVETSGVGRTTFYRNFDEVVDVLRLRSDQVFDDMFQHLIGYIHENGTQSRMMLLKPVLRYFYLHSEIIELLMQADRIDITQASLRRASKPFITRALTSGIDKAYVEYNVTIRIGIVTNILVQWIRTGKQEPPDELADTLSEQLKFMITLDQLL